MEGKNLKLANLEGGKTYYIELNLSQHNNPIWIQRWKGSAINVKDRTFQRDWVSFGANVTALELRLATTEEREWLNYCIEKDKYISYELMPIGWTQSDVVPEYVQLVKEHWSVDGEYVGEIFNLSDLSNLSKFKYAPTKNEFLKNINGWITQGHFKISDKKSYDLQNSKQYPLVPEECYDTEIEVGDEVEITINKYNHSPYKVGESFIIREISEQNGEIYYRPIEGRCTGIISTSVKLVKKANKTTTLDKKVDVISSKVPERLQLKIRETVVENTIEERIKLKLNNLKTIKIKQHVN